MNPVGSWCGVRGCSPRGMSVGVRYR